MILRLICENANSNFCEVSYQGYIKMETNKNGVSFRENCPQNSCAIPDKELGRAWDRPLFWRTLTLWQILDVERVFTYTSLLLPISHMLLRFLLLLKIVATAFPLTSPTTLQFHRYHCPQWVAPLHKTSSLYCPEKNIDRKTTTGKGKMRHYKIKRQLSHPFSLDFHDSTHSSFLYNFNH